MKYTKYLVEAKTAESVRKGLRTSSTKIIKSLADIENELDKISLGIDDLGLGTSDVGKSLDTAVDNVLEVRINFYNLKKHIGNL